MQLTIPLLLAIQTLSAQPGRFGLPACPASGHELATRSAFVLCHSSSLHVPTWTAHELKPSSHTSLRPARTHFRRDPFLSNAATDEDYRNSGYARGHMVPVADLAANETALRDSFLLSNAVPQNPRLNAGKWRILESTIRNLATTADSTLVLTGPIFCPGAQRIGANHVAVPCQLFKIALIIQGTNYTMLAAILPNDANPAQPLNHFAVSVREVEDLTGLDFFPQLPTELQETLETQVNPITR
ncbi:MAG: DNA/RNA non-specific endonuclease [Acidobacteria bacterium]|nr:DNA/RNA non-specific endonuclease [Acidobacteriota bacterium]